MIHLAPNGSPIWQSIDVDHLIADDSASGESVTKLPAWAATAYVELRTKLLDDHFPCTFGTVAQRKGDVLYTFLEPSTGEGECELVRGVLEAFTDLVRPLDPVDASLRPLVAVLPPPVGVTTIEEYFDHGWALLQWLHDHDARPWPAHVPRDPDDPHWSFCFGGVPLFVTFKTPAHMRRRSRRMPSAYVVLFQAREGFDSLAGDTPRGRRARALIRHKLVAYDGIPIPAALDHYGTPANREWRQYFAPDGDQRLAASCPFHTKTAR